MSLFLKGGKCSDTAKAGAGIKPFPSYPTAHLETAVSMVLDRGTYAKYQRKDILGSHQSNPESSRLWRLSEPRNASLMDMITYHEQKLVDDLIRCGP